MWYTYKLINIHNIHVTFECSNEKVDQSKEKSNNKSDLEY